MWISQDQEFIKGVELESGLSVRRGVVDVNQVIQVTRDSLRGTGEAR